MAETMTAHSQSFAYKNLRLVKAEAAGTYGTKEYNYDQAGNMTLKDGITYSYKGHQMKSGKKSGKGVPDAGTLYFHQNHLGSTAMTTNKQGAKVSRPVYLPYGGVYRLDGPDNFRPKFTGKELDKETQLYYYSARYTDPSGNQPHIELAFPPQPLGDDPQALVRLVA